MDAPITGDEFIAMNNGPVPSFIYDILKGVKQKKQLFNSRQKYS